MIVAAFEWMEPDTGQSCRVFSLADQTYAFQLEHQGIAVLVESQLDFDDAMARAERWRALRHGDVDTKH